MSATTLILKRLEEAGFSQSEISRRVHIPQPTLSKWAAGRAAKAADAALRLREMELQELGGSRCKDVPRQDETPAAIQPEAMGAAHV